MTRLLDTGFLETNDPVVAACFLKRAISARSLDEMNDDLTMPKYADWWDCILNEVGPEHVCWMYEEGSPTTPMGPYPILIPASVVAEVVGYKAGNRTTVDNVCTSNAIASYLALGSIHDGAAMIVDWLTEHTEDNDE